MNLIAAWPRLMDPELAKAYVGGETILAAMEKQGLVKPTLRAHKLTRYDRALLDIACDKFKGVD